MCGIAGNVDFERAPAATDVARLVESISHRGPDGQGVWRSRQGQCVLGHARLAVIDLSEHGHQPMLDPETGNAIVFNGEIYNFQSLREECIAAGDRFVSRTDTEVVLALYRRHGVGCLSRLRGMFAFAIWDEAQKRLVLARDRVGKKPLHYAVQKGGIVFGSAIDSLSRFPRIDRQMDREALDLYLHLQYIPAPWTIYLSIRKLPPAHYAIFDRAGLRIEQYWDVDYRHKAGRHEITEEQAIDGLEARLLEAVRARMIADVPMGALLSGGLDSSLIVALMSKVRAENGGEPVRTFSMGFREEAFNELQYARQAAQRCGSVHHEEIVEGDVSALLPSLARHFGEPFADSSAIPSFLVCRAARQHVTVVLNGDGGDELLGGYSRYAIGAARRVLAPAVSQLISGAFAASCAARLAGRQTFSARAARRLLDAVRPEIRSMTMYSQFWNDPQRAKLYPDGHNALVPTWRADWLRKAGNSANGAIDRMLWIDNRTYLPGDLLVKMDVASMHCGLEARSPLLDHRVIEYCATLPESFKARGDIGKYLLKRLGERYFPRAFVYRRKQGFAIPLAAWLRGPLRATLEEVVHDVDAMLPLRHRVAQAMTRDFLASPEDDRHASRLWALLMYGVWRRQSGVSI